MTKTVSFINMKGGVGKTTSSVTLAEACAAEFGWRVLVLDLDAQASASYALCGAEGYEEAVRRERTLAAYFDLVADGRRPEPLSDYRTRAGGPDAATDLIDVICSEPSLRYAERALIERYYSLRSRRGIFAKSGAEGQTRRILREQIDRLGKIYDLIVIDCPPGVSVFAEAGVSCSDLVVMPTIPDYLSTLGLRELNKRFLAQLKRDGELHAKRAILPTKVRPSDATHKRFLKILESWVSDGALDAAMLYTMIGQDAVIARALEPEHLGAAFKDKYGRSRADLVDFAREIKELLDDDRGEDAQPEREPAPRRRSGAGKPAGRSDAA